MTEIMWRWIERTDKYYIKQAAHITLSIYTLPSFFPHVRCGLHVVAWQYIYIQKNKSSRICCLSTVQAIFSHGHLLLPPLYPLFVVLGVPSRCQLTVFNTSHILTRIITCITKHDNNKDIYKNTTFIYKLNHFHFFQKKNRTSFFLRKNQNLLDIHSLILRKEIVDTQVWRSGVRSWQHLLPSE